MFSVGENGASTKPVVWETDKDLRRKAFLMGIHGDALVRKYIEMYRRSQTSYADIVPKDVVSMTQRR